MRDSGILMFDIHIVVNRVMCYKVFHDLIPWAPCDYFNIV